MNKNNHQDLKNNNILPLSPEREIRAVYNHNYIRVYQAYSDEIADSAIQNNSFVSPPFKMTRMTWIKPSFLWMMYRSGWGYKDDRQRRILAIDITHEGFLWALSNSCLSSFKPEVFNTREQWKEKKDTSPVKIQWDPERDILLNKLNNRTIQIGLSGSAVQHYANEWVVNITDITNLAHKIKSKIDSGSIEQAKELMPKEEPYVLTPTLTQKLGMNI